MDSVEICVKVSRWSRLVATVLALSSWTAAAQAGFFEDLFGDNETAPVRAAPQARPRQPASGSFSIRANVPSRRSLARKPGDAVSGDTKTQKAVFCAPNLSARANPDSDDVRLHDATLRAGDSLVTADGIVVFKGHAACPHTASDFVGLAQSKLPAAKRSALEQLEHTIRASRHPLILTDKDDDEPQVVSENIR
jgi:hypothetical protein